MSTSNSDSEGEDQMAKLAIHDEEEEGDQLVVQDEEDEGAEDGGENAQDYDDDGEDEASDEDAERRQQLAAGMDVPPRRPADPSFPQTSSLIQYVDSCNSSDPDRILEGVVALRKLLSIERNPPIQLVIDTGVVPRLVAIMRDSESPIAQFEASWALTNIASGTSAHTRTVVDGGALPIFIKLLKSPHTDVSEQAAWALGNIAGDSVTLRDMCINSDCITTLLECLAKPDVKVSMLRNAAQVISNMARGRPQPDFDKLKATLPYLARLLYSTDDEVLEYSCWAMSFLSDDSSSNNYRIDHIVQADCVRRLVELMLHANKEIQTPALRTVGNIVAGSDEHTQAVLNCNALPAFRQLLTNRKREIRKEACWVLSNCTDHLQRLIDADIFPELILVMRNDVPEVTKQANWALSNATSTATSEQMQYLVGTGIIPELTAQLQAAEGNEVVQVALEGLSNILKSGDLSVIDPKSGHSYASLCQESNLLARVQEIASSDLSSNVRQLASRFIRDYQGTLNAAGGGSASHDPKELDPKNGFSF